MSKKEELRYFPLVKTIALQVKNRLGADVELEELVRCGMAGLKDADLHFRTRHGTTFRMFAQYCIRAAMYKELLLREAPDVGLPLAFRSSANDLMQFHSGSAEGIVKRSVAKEVNELTHLIQCLVPVWLMCRDARGDLPLESKRTLDTAVARLENHERRILQCCYYEKLTPDAAAEKLQISKSSLFRTHWKVLGKIRASLTSKFAEKSTDKL